MPSCLSFADSDSDGLDICTVPRLALERSKTLTFLTTVDENSQGKHEMDVTRMMLMNETCRTVNDWMG